MLPYFIWNSENSLDNKIIVNKLPDIERPKERVEKIIVPERHGYLTQSDNTYEGTIKTVECTLDNGDINYINKWLTGNGEVTFSNEADKKYKANIINSIPFSEVIPSLNEFIAVFDCQPFKYKLNEEIITIVSNNSTIYNEGTFQSEPIIKIYGSGDIIISINGEGISMKNVDEYVTIDSVLKDCYKDDMLKNGDMIGDFPILNPGENMISFSGNVSKIDIKSNEVCI